jgi:hypothetical protein
VSCRLLHLIIALCLALPALGSGLAARAFPAAQIDAEIKPNFGALLSPPVRRHWPRLWRGRRYGYAPYPGYGGYYGNPYPDGSAPYPYYPGGPLPSITVNCNDPNLGPYPISDASERVMDGGVVYVHAGGMPCHESLQIDHPVVIAGEETSAFSTDPLPSPVVIMPPDDAPCVLIAQGVKEVELRGLVFAADKAGDNACIQGWNAEVALVRDEVDYTGDSSAIFVDGGKFVARDTRINAHTYDAAVLAVDSALDLYKVRVRAETTGIEVRLGPAESSIEQVGVITSRNGPPGSTGIIVRAERSGGSTLRISNAVVCGWRVALGLERAAKVEVKRSRFCRSSYGVMSDGGDFGITESAVGSDRIGVYVASGNARVTHNRIYDVFDDDDGILTEPGAGLTESDNWVFSRYNCDHFKWDGRRSCRPIVALPPAIRDEAAFDREDRPGWEVDGYDFGYMRDGPVTYFDKPKPIKPRGKQLHLFDWR